MCVYACIYENLIQIVGYSDKATKRNRFFWNQRNVCICMMIAVFLRILYDSIWFNINTNIFDISNEFEVCRAPCVGRFCESRQSNRTSNAITRRRRITRTTTTTSIMNSELKEFGAIYIRFYF